MGNAAVGCEDYVFSGQSVVANFGFVREQGMHLAFDPKKAWNVVIKKWETFILETIFG